MSSPVPESPSSVPPTARLQSLDALRGFGGPIGAACGRDAELVLALTSLAFLFWFMRFLYQRRIFLRV